MMIRKILLIGVVLGLLMGLAAMPTQAATEDEIEDSVVEGLAWLAGEQQADGGWGGLGECDRVAKTGLVVLKFEDRAIDLRLDPMGDEYEYADQVKNGLAFIAALRLVQPIGVEPAGDPDGDGDGIGVYWDAVCGPWHQIYNTGTALMALSASGHPEIYGDMAQDTVDYLAWAQTDPDCGLDRGGWRYGADECASDNSNAGYATLGLGFAQAAPPHGFGLTVPQFVKDELSIWIDVMQDDVDGDPDDGGSWYDIWTPWVNMLKTGNLLYEMALSGDSVDDQRVQDAIDYIERHWNDPGGCDTGWRDHRQAMFTMMKGLQAFGIDMIDLDGDGVSEYNWFDEVSTHLVTTQMADGSWPWDCWGDPVLSTAWALLTLEKAVPPINTPPTAECIESVNPSGKNIPPAGSTTLPGAKGGRNEDGFYMLIGTDVEDDEAGVPVTVCVNNASGTVSFCFPSGTVVKITEAPGVVPSSKPMGGPKSAVAAHIILDTDAYVYAVDSEGAVSEEPALCYVPPPPK